jgi:hypothetical protein
MEDMRKNGQLCPVARTVACEGPRTGQIIIINCLKKMRIYSYTLKKGCKSNGTEKSVRINILTHSVPGFDYAAKERRLESSSSTHRSLKDNT